MNFKIIPFLLLGTAAHAAILKPLDGLNVIEVSISKEELTRIAVKDDRILNVIGLTGAYVLEADDNQGQVFIRPLDQGTLKPISLTIITEGGHTQDLRLVPKNKTPEALILLPQEGHQQEISSLWGKQVHLKNNPSHVPLSKNEVESLLQACQERRIPLGYKLAPLDLKNSSIREETLNVSSLLIRELKGEKLRGLTYDVQNRTEDPLILSEPTFIKSLDLPQNSIVAVLMPKKSLASEERTVVYVVAQSID